MKPCPRFKKQIALLAARSLSDDESRLAQNHLSQCPGCREYWHDVTELCGEHFEFSADLPTVEPDDRFHQRLTARIRAGEATQKFRSAALGNLLDALIQPRWKVAFAAAVAMSATVLLVVLRPRQSAEGPVAYSTPRRGLSVRAVEVAPQPTLMAYRLAASRSFEELDALLTREADRPLRATPLLTASARRELGLAE